MRVFDTDNQRDVDILLGLRATSDPEALPRIHPYASAHAVDAGLEPLEAYPDVLIPEDEYRERLEEAHEMQTLPIYHMYETWCPQGTRFNQDGLGYCWTWSGTACMMTTRAAEDKNLTPLSPVSMGYLVGWANRGNYLESYIKGAREQGVCPVPEGKTFNDLTRDGNYWDSVGRRDEFRLDKVWDCSPRSMTQHCVSILCYGRPIFGAWNWWGHAVMLCGIRYNGNTMEWILRNSHNEDDVIVLTGSRAVPSEAYGFISTLARTQE